MRSLRLRRNINAAVVIFALILASLSITSVLAGGLAASGPQDPLTISGQVSELNGTPVANVTMTFTLNRMGTIETRTTQTDASGNYASGDLGCPNSAKVEPSS